MKYADNPSGISFKSFFIVVPALLYSLPLGIFSKKVHKLSELISYTENNIKTQITNTAKREHKGTVSEEQNQPPSDEGGGFLPQGKKTEGEK